MPEAKFQIKRKCEVCGNTFIAKTLDSRYCCRHCTDIAYKNRKAAKAKEEQLNQIAQLIPGEREFISVKEAVAMYAISRDTIYRLVRKGRLRSPVFLASSWKRWYHCVKNPSRMSICYHVSTTWSQRIAILSAKSPRNSG